MKNIIEILKEIAGIEIPADKKEGFDKALNENYKTINEYEKVKTARDTANNDLAQVKASLAKFDGVDVEKMKTDLKTLQDTMTENEKKHKSEIEEKDFMFDLQTRIQKRGAKNEKFVMAALDLDALRKSTDRSKDIDKALDDCQKENDYLFEAKKDEEDNQNQEPFKNPTGRTQGTEQHKEYTADQLEKMTMAEYISARNQ